MTTLVSAPLICFDLGRVLVRICEGWSDAHAAVGLPGTPPQIGDDTRAAVARRVHALEVGALPVETFIDECAALLGLPRTNVASMLDAWVRGAYPGAVVLLDELRARGLPTACLSNTNLRHWQLMQAWQAPEDRVFQRLDLRYASHELGARKPDAAIYAEVERRTPSHAPGAIWFFDDLPDNITAARARGWQAHLVSSRADPVSEMRAILVAAGLLA